MTRPVSKSGDKSGLTRRRGVCSLAAGKRDDWVENFRSRIKVGDVEGCSRMLARLEKLTPLRAQAIVSVIGPAMILRLPKIRGLDADSAAELSKCRGGLSLPNLAELSPQVARALTGAPNNRLFLVLNGLGKIDAPTARVLARGCEYLALGGLKKIDQKAARALASGTAHVELRGLLVPDQQTLKALAEGSKGHARGSLSFGGIRTRTLSDEVASALVKINKSLCLEGVYFLRLEVAKILGRARRDLLLPAVCRLDDEALAFLARVRGLLDLSGLKKLPPSGGGGIRALATRTGLLRLGFKCEMGRGSRMLLRAGGHLQLAAREPSEVPARRAELLLNPKVSWNVREPVAKSVCEDVYRKIAGEAAGPCKATRERWLAEQVDVEPDSKAAGFPARGVSCFDVVYFLLEREVETMCRGNKTAVDFCYEAALTKARAWLTTDKDKTIEIANGGRGLFLYLCKTVKNASVDGWREYERSLQHFVNPAADQAEGHDWSARALPPEGDARKRHADVMAQAERAHTDAVRALARAEKGRIRTARKKGLDALLWLEWLKEKEEWSESGRKGKLTQQKFVKNFNSRHPALHASQSTLSRLIKQHREEAETERES